MNQKDLNEVLRLHKLWTNKKDGGVRADLSSEILRGANLSRAVLEGATMNFANLEYADLTHATMNCVTLEYANLERANLEGANLLEANLSFANLSFANLSEANLSGADLSRADLSHAALYHTDLSGATLPEFQIPQFRDLTGYKKVRDEVVLELLIPDGARRTASLIGNKCRCERALVVRALNSDLKVFRSYQDPAFIYRIGEFVEENGYNDDIRHECKPGIHFFLTREEAENY